MAIYMTEESKDEKIIGTQMTTSHYIRKSDRKNCQNQSCAASFLKPGLKRPHHCRRCGEIFCMSCLQYKRRMNAMAQLDPDGVPCKVCLSCFEDRGDQSLECTIQSHTQLFQQLRQQTRKEMTDIMKDCAIVTRQVTEQPTFWKEQFKVDILKECQRLLQGFKSSTNGSGTLSTLHEIKDHVNVPNWQKSTFWTLESHTSRCRHCAGKLGHRKKMRNCRVCGLALCKTCSQKELLLYFEDDERHEKTAEVHLAVIRFHGCPDVEPQCSLLLRCCKGCKEEIISRQVEDDKWYLEKTKPPDLESEIVRMDDQFRSLVDGIREDMGKLTSGLGDPGEITNADTIDGMLVSETRTQEKSSKQFETMKGRINERLKAYWTVCSELNSLINQNSERLAAGAMSVFIMNYVKARKEFYIEAETKFLKMSRERASLDVKEAAK